MHEKQEKFHLSIKYTRVEGRKKMISNDAIKFFPLMYQQVQIEEFSRSNFK